MFRNVRLTILSLAAGLTAYFIYAVVLVPVLIIPRTARRHINMPRSVLDSSAEVKRMSRINSELLSVLFPDPNDWRRVHPLSVTPKDRSWILLFPNEPHLGDGNLTFDSCTMVVPVGDAHLPELERFRRALVVETNDKLEIRFKGQPRLSELAGSFSPDNLEGGRLFGQVSVWSNMEPETLADDFRLITRNISFNLEQLTTDSEVIVHYGNRQAEGVGLRVNIDVPLKKKEESDSVPPQPDQLDQEREEGNLALGFSIRDVSLDRLNRLEFEIPDYLPNLPEAGEWDAPGETAPAAEPEEEDDPPPVKMNIRCRDKVYFAPNTTDAPSVWCARFAEDVEITAFHEERQPDSLRCDYLYFYLDDPVLRQMWERFGASYKGKRKPSGKLTRLTPYQIRAIGTPGRKSTLQLASGLFTAEGGEILCEIDRRRIALQPLPDSLVSDDAEPLSPADPQVTMQYGSSKVVSDRIEYIYDPGSHGELRAYKKGRLEAETPAGEPGAPPEQVTVEWNDLVQIAPVPGEADQYAASFRGGVSAASKRFGTLTAREADFWFLVRPKGESPAAGEGGLPPFSPHSARLRGDIQIGTPRGECLIRDEMEILFDRQAASADPTSDSAPPPDAPAPEKNPFALGGSLMGGEEGSDYRLSAGKLKIWAEQRADRGIDIAHIVMLDQILFVETDPKEKKEVLHIDGSDVRIEKPSSDQVSVILRGRPANFTGGGLDLSGYDIRVNRPENTFSVIGSGQLEFTPDRASASAVSAASPVGEEPVRVWWPNGMTFDGKSLVFQGKISSPGSALAGRPKSSELVHVRQGNSLELKSMLISLTLKRPVQIFEFEMGKDASGGSRIELDQMICQGNAASPVALAWFGKLPARDGGGDSAPGRGRASGEAAYMTYSAESGDFTASGPGWLRGTVETPKGEGGSAETAPGGPGGDLIPSSKPWTHFHLVFHDRISGNIRTQSAKAGGDVRLALAGSEKSDLDLNVNDHASFPPDTFFLTCDELGAAQVLSPSDRSRNLELTAMGNTRFDYQAYTGRGEVLKYDHRKRTVVMQGSGIVPAALSQQDRPGAPVNTQTFNSASFNLETKGIDLNLSSTGFSAGN